MDCLFAQYAVRVITSTKSGQSLVLNIGWLEGIKEREIAKMYINTGTQLYPKMVNIGQAEVIKLEASQSYWFIKKPLEKFKLKHDSVVLLYVKSRTFDGLGNVKVTYKKIVVPVKVNTKKLKKKLERGMPSDLIMAEDGFRLGRRLLKKKMISDSNLVAISAEHWKKSNKKFYDHNKNIELTVKRTNGINRVAPRKSIVNPEEDYIYETLVKGSTEKVNNLYYGIEELYDPQRRDVDQTMLKKNISITNLYDQRKENLKKKTILTDATKEYIDIEGPLWSASMSDQQLRRFIHNSGITSEKMRRHAAVTARLGHEFIFGLTSMLTNQTDEADPNHRGTSYSLNLGYELHLQRLSLSLYRFGLEFFFHRGVHYYPLAEGVNGRFQVGGFSGALNLYLYNRPTTLNKIIWYTGLGIYRGEATVDSIELSQNYKYQIYSFPTFQTGLKYRFSNINDYYGETPIGVGISMKYGLNTSSVSVMNTIAEEDTLDGSNSFAESKLSMAVNVYF